MLIRNQGNCHYNYAINNFVFTYSDRKQVRMPCHLTDMKRKIQAIFLQKAVSFYMNRHVVCNIYMLTRKHVNNIIQMKNYVESSVKNKCKKYQKINSWSVYL
eukprot:GHVU01028141.1.p1 GENE.GHVU01028141.1~~GHVU01028141.1.p1  ORF type:complete len:102 (+),score=4.86 GHVU01028141.1:197-502(+)